MAAADITADSLKTFITENQLPMVIEFTQESAQKVFGGDIKNHLLYFLSKESDDFEAIIADYRLAATEFKGKVSNGNVMLIFNIYQQLVLEMHTHGCCYLSKHHSMY